MNIKDGYISKKVTFDTQDGLEEKIDRLTSMVNKLTTQDGSQNKQFKPKIYQGKRRGEMRNVYCRFDYDQRNYKNIDQIVEKGEYHSLVEYNMNKVIEIDLGIIRTIEMILGKKMLKEI